ncbi:hypothetical protein NC651_030400 [Populus alba x Populus x berolinensis]|nr:hypothetical protein NC651_030400 [Populus alba x Populus x berolinensis]
MMQNVEKRINVRERKREGSERGFQSSWRLHKRRKLKRRSSANRGKLVNILNCCPILTSTPWYWHVTIHMMVGRGEIGKGAMNQRCKLLGGTSHEIHVCMIGKWDEDKRQRAEQKRRASQVMDGFLYFFFFFFFFGIFFAEI